MSKLRLWKRKKKKIYNHSGTGVFDPIYKQLVKDINEQIRLGFVKFTRTPNHVSLDIIDPIGLAIWWNLKLNSPHIKKELEKIKNEFKDLEKEEETDS